MMNDLQTGEPEEVTVSEWIITLIITIIPIVNVVMYLVWAFGNSAKPSKANWAKASVILFAGIVILYLLIFVIVMGIGAF
ncbi:MAG: hypothetical protein EA391_14550 [Balneolaceae bacterium]|nr:MAG: hypothetical protein EA391_14550 [Balneolaceae bacterium]